MYAPRDRRRSEARILYWFRTPPNVRVGRAALDEEAIRTLEESHPDVTFDWTRILRVRPPEQPAVAEGGREGRRRDRPARGGKARGAERDAPRAKQRERRPEQEAAAPVLAAARDEEPAEAIADQIAEARPGALWTDAEDERGAQPERPSLPPGLHVEERLGPEGFSRLRARHAELMARISERVQDPVVLGELRTEAERLNPDTWITDEEAKAGIEGFDAAYEAIRARLGRRRRRSRRGGARRRRSREAQVAAADGTEAAAPLPPIRDAAEDRDDEAETGSEPAGSDDEAE